jgi:hypothetical protein
MAEPVKLSSCPTDIRELCFKYQCPDELEPVCGETGLCPEFVCEPGCPITEIASNPVGTMRACSPLPLPPL